MVGKQQPSLSQSSSKSIVAANPFFSKSVFCIDNVATDVTENILKKFITDMNIHVVSCFKVAPRKPSWWNKERPYIPNRNTFRVCIARHDNDKLLNADMWPEYISISTWVFKEKQSSEKTVNLEKRQDVRRSSPDADQITVASPPRFLTPTEEGSESAGTSFNRHDPSEVTGHDMDTTLNYNYGIE